MSLIENERLKLTANWINTLAAASVVAGVIAPVVAVTYGSPMSTVSALTLVLGVAVWFAVGSGLHLIARSLLNRLKP